MSRPAGTDTQEQWAIRQWLAAGRRAGPILEELKAAELRATDTVSARERLDGLFTHAVESLPARASSGLLHPQAIFARARR